ncbi:MAG: hypothetical protein V2I48_11430 [Xanthomonadales bacterium]|nr:hypothetical protein [Xanthomonadales bacterium]
MNSRATVLIACFLLAATPAAAADRALPKPNWNRHAAIEASSLAETRIHLESLFELAREGRGEELMRTVRAIELDAGWTDPAREKVLHSLALALGDFEPGVIGPQVLEYLAERRSRILVPHEEHPGMGVPLFNIRAAATGSLAEWSRHEKRLRAERTRLDSATAIPQAENFVRSIAASSDAETAARIRAARGLYDPAELEFIVASAPTMHDVATASLVLAELAPVIIDRPETMDLLFSLLEHRELGATAALALANSGNEAVFDRLAILASSGEDLAAKRALLAIEAFHSTRDLQ